MADKKPEEKKPSLVVVMVPQVDLDMLLQSLKATNNSQVQYNTDPLVMANTLLARMTQSQAILIEKLETFLNNPGQEFIFEENKNAE